jgi:uncharacterized protein (TIGR00251 family)
MASQALGKSSSRPWAPVADGIVLDVRLAPRSGRDAIDGLETRADGRPVLKVRVRAAPFEGEANVALQRLIAKALGVAPRQVEIASGATARVKRLRIFGDAPALAAALERVTQSAARGA